MTEKAADLYSRYGKINSDTAVPIITQWIDCILVAEDLFDFHRRVKDIGILCLSKTSSESVQNVCTNMRTKTKRSKSINSSKLAETGYTLKVLKLSHTFVSVHF